MDGQWAVTASQGLWQVGGTTPRQASVPVSAFAVHFADATHGWIAGDGRVYVTSDRGAHWTPQLDATQGTTPEFAGGPAMLTFPSATTGWALFVSASGHVSQKAYALYRMADGGGHWVQVVANRFLSNPDQGAAPRGPGGYPIALAAPDRADAYLVFFAPAPNAVIVDATHDGGQTWSNNVGQPTLTGTFPNVAVTFTDAPARLDGDLTGGHLTLWSTQDAATTWTRRYAIGT